MNRNTKHKHVSKKYGCDREILLDFENENDAFEFEKLCIVLCNTYAYDNDVITVNFENIGCNFTKGGEGSGGHVPWNKGKKATLGARKNMSKSHIGKICPWVSEFFRGKKQKLESIKKRARSNTGKKRSEKTRQILKDGALRRFENPEERQKISKAGKGKHFGFTPWNKGTKGAMIAWNKGKKATASACKNQAAAQKRRFENCEERRKASEKTKRYYEMKATKMFQTKNDKIKLVVVVDKSLNMRKGKMCAQVGHASLLMIIDALNQENQTLNLSALERDWLASGMAKIVVGCDSLEELNRIADHARSAGVKAKFVVDSGATEFHGEPTTTCLALGPDESAKIDKITGDLRLL